MDLVPLLPGHAVSLPNLARLHLVDPLVARFLRCCIDVEGDFVHVWVASVLSHVSVRRMPNHRDEVLLSLERAERALAAAALQFAHLATEEGEAVESIHPQEKRVLVFLEVIQQCCSATCACDHILEIVCAFVAAIHCRIEDHQEALVLGLHVGGVLVGPEEGWLQGSFVQRLVELQAAIEFLTNLSLLVSELLELFATECGDLAGSTLLPALKPCS
mmetsp:Transcript_40782/g.87568  ORF Transcript_40782/g.87568 Transcript_40782/m.87568 type:complete len:217 (+) Transcript_40782:2193-2843(+)